MRAKSSNVVETRFCPAYDNHIEALFVSMPTTYCQCLCRCSRVGRRAIDVLLYMWLASTQTVPECGKHTHTHTHTHTHKHNKRRARTRIRWKTLQIEAWIKRYFGVSGIRPDSLVVKHPVCEFRGDPGSTPGRGFFSSCAFALVSSIPLFCLCSFGQFFHTQHAHTTALIQRHAATAP